MARILALIGEDGAMLLLVETENTINGIEMFTSGTEMLTSGTCLRFLPNDIIKQIKETNLLGDKNIEKRTFSRTL